MTALFAGSIGRRAWELQHAAAKGPSMAVSQAVATTVLPRLHAQTCAFADWSRAIDSAHDRLTAALTAVRLDANLHSLEVARQAMTASSDALALGEHIDPGDMGATATLRHRAILGIRGLLCSPESLLPELHTHASHTRSALASLRANLRHNQGFISHENYIAHVAYVNRDAPDPVPQGLPEPAPVFPEEAVARTHGPEAASRTRAAHRRALARQAATHDLPPPPPQGGDDGWHVAPTEDLLPGATVISSVNVTALPGLLSLVSTWGYVAIQEGNTAVKLVDRLSFSVANFNVEKNWVNGDTKQ